jgi:hypothetical protein
VLEWSGLGAAFRMDLVRVKVLDQYLWTLQDPMLSHDRVDTTQTLAANRFALAALNGAECVLGWLLGDL